MSKKSDRASNAAVAASRVFVAIAVASLDASEQKVTLPQYRALVVLEANGAQDLVSLATAMGLSASSASRLVDRLVAGNLVDRELDPDNRRHVVLTLTAAGNNIIKAVLAYRYAALDRVLAAMPAADRVQLGALLEVFTEAARDSSPWESAPTL